MRVRFHVFLGALSVLCLLGVALPVLFIGQHYAREGVVQLSDYLRDVLPLATESALTGRLEVMPRFMNSTTNLIEDLGVDVQTWEGALLLKEVMTSYLRTFPKESRCCSGMITLPVNVSLAPAEYRPDAGTEFDIWNLLLMRPQGRIDWFYNMSGEDSHLVNRGDLGKTPKAKMMQKMKTYFHPDLPEVDTAPKYNPAVVWLLDEPQLQLRCARSLYSRTTGGWVGTYITGFKLGFLSDFLRQELAIVPAWKMFLVDSQAPHAGVLLAGSVDGLPILSCYPSQHWCDVYSLPNASCVICAADVKPGMVLAVDSKSALVAGAARAVSAPSGWTALHRRGKAPAGSVTADGVEYLLSTFPVSTHGVMWVGILCTPYDEVYGELEHGWRVAAGIGLTLVAVGVVVAVVVSWGAAAPLTALSFRMQRAAHLSGLDDSPPNSWLAALVEEFYVCEKSCGAMMSTLKEYKSYIPTSVLTDHLGQTLSQASMVFTPAPSGDVALLFSDIKGSTALWAESADGMNLALEMHNSVIRDVNSSHGGYEVKTIGDAFMVAYSSPSIAVRAATEIQSALAEKEWPASITLPQAGLVIRIGVNSGPVVTEINPITGRQDYRGSTVNCASRVEAKAMGGTTCVTQAVVDAISTEMGSLKVVVAPYGKHELKGLGRGHVLYLVSAQEQAHRLEQATSDCFLSEGGGGGNPLAVQVPMTPSSDSLSETASEAKYAPPTPQSPRRLHQIARVMRTKLSLRKGTIAVAVCKVNDAASLHGEVLLKRCNLMVRAAVEATAATDGEIGNVSGASLSAVWCAGAERNPTTAALQFASRMRSTTGGTVRVGLASGPALRGNVGTAKMRFATSLGLVPEAADVMADFTKRLDVSCLLCDCSADGSLAAMSKFRECLRLVDVWEDSSSNNKMHIWHSSDVLLGDALEREFYADGEVMDPAMESILAEYKQMSAWTEAAMRGLDTPDGRVALTELEVAAVQNPKDGVLRHIVAGLKQSPPFRCVRLRVSLLRIPAQVMEGAGDSSSLAVESVPPTAEITIPITPIIPPRSPPPHKDLNLLLSSGQVHVHL